MIDSGDTAWVLAASALVLLMTPGLAFFYGGLVRKKNIVSTIMYSFVTIGLVGIVWVLWGYSLAFGNDVEGWGLIGDLGWFGLKSDAIRTGIGQRSDSHRTGNGQEAPPDAWRLSGEASKARLTPPMFTVCATRVSTATSSPCTASSAPGR